MNTACQIDNTVRPTIVTSGRRPHQWPV